MSDISSIIKERKIYYVYHFTQAWNLGGIFQNGLLSRSELTRRGEAASLRFSDSKRLDHCRDAVCVSIGFPNYKMFYKKRQEHPDVDWVVLRIDVKVLHEMRCEFCWTNAASKEMSQISREVRSSAEALEAMFGDHPGLPLRDNLGIYPNYPTDPQAEVLVLDSIPSNYIRAVYFENKTALDKFSKTVPAGVKTLVSGSDSKTDYFSCRKDAQYWKSSPESERQ